ncbi:isopenicillin-N N-acyltransferase like protein [Arthrobacter sp. yr096]|uniref:C45 family autoproteolytic acyltransferase/hydolase n=1 Tax=Arthrobacter sp. yr096 TaxID=1761750 RepID=UPI0008C2ECD3|nr:C45 family peptidase [Arthrobacter sp. yr096]SEI74593.1 isopenicillin-N N-acyltransferase like protein [Arthrobacter sp. yr096]
MQLHRHTSAALNPRERGLDIGSTWNAQTRNTAKLYGDFFATLGIDARTVRTIAEQSHQALSAWSPALAEEAEGWAEGAGLETWQLSVVNSRTEILAAAPKKPGSHECSTAVYVPAGAAAPQTLQTWDWHHHLAPEGLLLEVTPSPGRITKTFTEFGTLGKIGVNSEGLGLHFNILAHRSDDESAGVPVHAIARRILDEASSIDDAIAIASSARVSASTVYTVFTATAVSTTRRAVSIEVSPAGTAVVDTGSDGWLLHTNHFLDPHLAQGDAIDDGALSPQRLAHLGRVRTELTGLGVTDRAKQFCSSEGASSVVCFHPDASAPRHEQWQTLLTISVNASDGSLDYAAANPADAASAGFQTF